MIFSLSYHFRRICFRLPVNPIVQNKGDFIIHLSNMHVDRSAFLSDSEIQSRAESRDQKVCLLQTAPSSLCVPPLCDLDCLSTLQFLGIFLVLPRFDFSRARVRTHVSTVHSSSSILTIFILMHTPRLSFPVSFLPSPPSPHSAG